MGCCSSTNAVCRGWKGDYEFLGLYQEDRVLSFLTAVERYLAFCHCVETQAGQAYFENPKSKCCSFLTSFITVERALLYIDFGF